MTICIYSVLSVSFIVVWSSTDLALIDVNKFSDPISFQYAYVLAKSHILAVRWANFGWQPKSSWDASCWILKKHFKPSFAKNFDLAILIYNYQLSSTINPLNPTGIYAVAKIICINKLLSCYMRVNSHIEQRLSQSTGLKISIVGIFIFLV